MTETHVTDFSWCHTRMSTFLRIRQLLSPLTFSCRHVPLSRPYATEVPTPSSSAQERTSTPFVRIVDGLYKTYKPITPSIRHLRRPLTPYLYPGRPLRLLTRPQRSTGGRNANGRVTVRGRGGGHKRRLRDVDFMRKESGIQDVVRIEYDPGRSGHIALLKSRDPHSKQPWSYILAPEGLRAGHTVQSFRDGIPDGLVPGFVDTGKKGGNGETIATVAPGVVTPEESKVRIHDFVLVFKWLTNTFSRGLLVILNKASH